MTISALNGCVMIAKAVAAAVVQLMLRFFMEWMNESPVGGKMNTMTPTGIYETYEISGLGGGWIVE